MFQTQSIFVPKSPFKFWTYMNFFEDFIFVFQMNLLTQIKKIDVGTGALRQRQDVFSG